MIKLLNVEDLVDSTPGMLKVRLYVYLSRKYMFTKTDPEVMIEDARKVFQDEEVIPLIAQWLTKKKG